MNTVTHLFEFIREKRLEKEISLREFCRSSEMDPSNWSKIERGIIPVPKAKPILTRIASSLKLNSDETQFLFDLAIVDSIPAELGEENVLNKLPLFFRTIRGEKPNEKDLRKLIKTIRES